MPHPTFLTDLPPHPGDGQWSDGIKESFDILSNRYSLCHKLWNSENPDLQQLRLIVDQMQKHLIPMTLGGMYLNMDQHPWAIDTAIVLITMTLDLENTAQTIETGIKKEIKYPEILGQPLSSIRECSVGVLAHLCFPPGGIPRGQITDDGSMSLRLSKIKVTNADGGSHSDVENIPGGEMARLIRERRKQRAIAKNNSKPQRIFTISASCADDQTKIKVPLQHQTYTRDLVIPSSLASVSSASLGISQLLQELNEILGTAYTLESPVTSQLQKYIDQDYDFGTVYAYLRPYWHQNNVQQDLQAHEAEDTKRRQNAMGSQDRITNPDIPPRRVWDLYSNRIIPWWITGGKPITPVSHAWMSIELRQNINTPINSYQWPVPIPINTTLEHVRIELLHHRVEYAWLDVLCLRQVGDQEKEALRLQEWRIDVPTIGSVYGQNRKTVHYFSGLGLPFEIGDLKSDRHWLNRAWTLQEATMDSISAGITPNSPDPMDFDDASGEYRDPDAGKFYNALSSLSSYLQKVESVFPVLDAMRNRAAVSELDKIAGLAYPLRLRVLPAYIPGQASEDAWRRLIETMLPKFRGDLLFGFPVPGDGRHLWRPSWNQVKNTPLPKGELQPEEVEYNQQDDTYFHRGYRINHCLVEGLAKVGDIQEIRNGTVIITEGNGHQSDFKVFANHRQPIPNGEYTLVGCQGAENWVVGRVNASGKIEKISVIRLTPGVPGEPAPGIYRMFKQHSAGKVLSEWA